MYYISKNVLTYHINSWMLLHYHQHNNSSPRVVYFFFVPYPQWQRLWPATRTLTSSPRWPQSSSVYFLRYCFSYSDHGPAGWTTDTPTDNLRRAWLCVTQGCADCLLPCDPCRLGSPQWLPGWRGPLWGRWPPVLRATCPPAIEPCGFATMASCPRRYILRDWDARQAVSFALQ